MLAIVVPDAGLKIYNFRERSIEHSVEYASIPSLTLTLLDFRFAHGYLIPPSRL